MRNTHSQTTLRFTPELHSKLKALASKECRSVNAQIVHILQNATAGFGSGEAKPTPPLQITKRIVSTPADEIDLDDIDFDS